MIFSQRVTRLRATTTTDRYGQEVLDWTAPGQLDVDRVAVVPRARTETTGPDGRATVTSGWWLSTRPGVDLDLTAADRIEWAGLVLEVDGEVARWPDPWGGGVHHVEAALRRVTG